jgi:uncharacterized membrane protein YfcA
MRVTSLIPPTAQILTLAYATLCIFIAGIIRGYSGFGFSLLAVTSISILMPPAQIIPSIFLMEVAASVSLLPEVWRDIHWRPLVWLSAGCLVGTPFGVYALAHAPVAPMTLALAVFVLISALMLAQGHRLQRLPGPLTTFATGAASGVFNGGFGMGGPPVVLFFFSSPTGAAAGRATLIAFFLLTDLVGLAWQSGNGLITIKSLWLSALFMPPLLAGIWLGNRSFKTADPAAVRIWVLRLLMLLALLAGVRALLHWN